MSVRDIDAFKREHELVPVDAGGDGESGPRLDEEPDLRAEDDALVAAELDAEPEEDEDDPSDDDDSDDSDDPDDPDKPRKRRRGRRGGRGRRTGGRGSRPLEGTFDHGEEGYGLWLDPAVQDNATYAEHWAGHRPVTVTIEADRIVIERGGENGGANEDDEEETPPESNLDPDQFDA